MEKRNIQLNTAISWASTICLNIISFNPYHKGNEIDVSTISLPMRKLRLKVAELPSGRTSF